MTTISLRAGGLVDQQGRIRPVGGRPGGPVALIRVVHRTPALPEAARIWWTRRRGVEVSTIGPVGPVTGGQPGQPVPPGQPVSPGQPVAPGAAVPGATVPPGAALPLPGAPPPAEAGPVRPLTPPVAVAPQPGLPADGPRPGDDTALREVQRTLAASLAGAGLAGELAARLRDTVLSSRPQLAALLPGGPEAQREQLRAAVTWLVDNLDRPSVVAAGCGQLGGVLREYGVAPQQVQLLGAALAEALRAAAAGAWRQEYDRAWRTTWRLAHRWITHGAEAAEYQPVQWSAVVIGHEQRLADLAVLRLRPYLPYPFLAGQYTRLEVAELPGVWRPYSLAGAPRPDHELELHVRAKGTAGISGVLVHRTGVGDRVRLRSAGGEMVLAPASRRDLLLIAGDTGVAPMKAMLAQLAATGDRRSAVLFWGVRTLADLYDVTELDALAKVCRRATVIPVVSNGDPGPYPGGLVTDAVAAYGQWSEHEVFLAGPPAMVAATRQVLGGLGIAADRIHHDPAS